MAGPDRKNALLGQRAITGIDFVAVHASQVTMDVFLFHDPSAPAYGAPARAMTPPLALAAGDVTITGEEEPTIPVVSATLTGPVDGREVLRVVVARPGGFGRYWLELAGSRIDPFFRRLELDFKSACPRDLDCATPPHECPPADLDEVLVDGSARDFWSLRRALLELASLRHPSWKDRLEADVGVMMVEALAALGDELAYIQDRHAREARFATAGQRRSVRRHVRLVDYELHDGLGARGWIAVIADASPPGWKQLPAGTPVWAVGDGVAVGFEVGDGLVDALPAPPTRLAPRTFAVHDRRNKLAAHLWDRDEPDPHAEHRPMAGACLPAGSTQMHLRGHHATELAPGDRVFLVSEPPPAERDLPLRRLLVTLTEVADEIDPLGVLLSTSTDVTRIAWKEPTPFELNLEWTSLLGNVVPVTAGVTRTTTFSIGGNLRERPQAIERTGPNRSIAFLHSLPTRGPGPASPLASDAIWPYLEDQEVVRLGDEPRASAPEVAVHETAPPLFELGAAWAFRPTLVGTNSSLPQDSHFTLDDGTWARAVGYQRAGGEVVHDDYLSGTGSTVRFGDGEFGRMPPRGNAAAGHEVFFTATYRLGNGARGNLPADALRYAAPPDRADPLSTPATAWPGLPWLLAVSNPLATTGGVDAETLAQAKRDAPEEYRALTYRAVRPEDYDQAAMRLAWVQQAGTRFRWTGSWSTAFTTADPRHQAELPPDQRRALAAHLDSFRMTGREVHVLAPRYADLDLRITVCVEAFAYPAQVVAAIVRALIGSGGMRPVLGFFHPDRFTFGTALDRSELEAWIQSVPGVRAVKRVEIARRGWFERRDLVEPYYQPAADEVIRVQNDRRHPERGTVVIVPEGGA